MSDRPKPPPAVPNVETPPDAPVPVEEPPAGIPVPGEAETVPLRLT